MTDGLPDPAISDSVILPAAADAAPAPQVISPARRRPRTTLPLLLAAALLGVTAWAYSQLAASQAEAARAQEDLQACRRAAARIVELRQRPSLAADQDLQREELTAKIEAAVARAAIPADRLVQVSPAPPRRVGESAYKEKPTQVVLRGVTLRQAITFLHGLAGEGTTLRAAGLRLSAPRDREAGEGWSLEATLTYLIYAPVTAGDAAVSAEEL